MAVNECVMIKVQLKENISRISDILEQLDKLNQMIAFHQEESGEVSMIRQYEEMKGRFVEELANLLLDFQIKVQIQEEAA